MGDTAAPAEPQLELPYYGAPMLPALRRFFRKYATFSGRASRAEYWWWTLIAFIVSVLFQVVGMAAGQWRPPLPQPAATVSQLATIAVALPSLALLWRRLHDSNRSGLWALVALVPLAGWIVLFLFTVAPADPAGHRFDRRRPGEADH